MPLFSWSGSLFRFDDGFGGLLLLTFRVYDFRVVGILGFDTLAGCWGLHGSLEALGVLPGLSQAHGEDLWILTRWGGFSVFHAG